MAPTTASITVRGRAHPMDCIKWHDDRLILATQNNVALIRVAPSSTSTIPMEIATDMSKLGAARFVCTSEDATSLTAATVNNPKVVSATYSPYGVGPHCHRLVAVLTSDHKCAVYASSKDPDKDKWSLCHALLPTALGRLGYNEADLVESIDSIKHLRITSINWTSPYFHSNSRWGDSFLVTGTEGGEVHFRRIDSTRQDLVFVINCSEDRISKIECVCWSADGVLTLLATDSNGNVNLLTCPTAVADGRARLTNDATCRTLLHTFGTINNLACTHRSSGDLLAAIATPGELQVLLTSATTGKVTTSSYLLPYYAVTSGLFWTESDSEVIHLYIFGHSGKVLVLEYSCESSSLQLSEPLTNSIRALQKETVLSHQNDLQGRRGESLMLQYRGASKSLADLFFTTCYTVEPVDRIQYKIPSTYESHVAMLPLSDDPGAGLRHLLQKYLQSPYIISLSAIISLHQRLAVPVLASLDAVASQQTPDAAAKEEFMSSSSSALVDNLFRSRLLNSHRVALASKALSVEVTAQVRTDLEKHLTHQILSRGSSYDPPHGDSDRHLVSRYANYVLSHPETHADLEQLATTALRHVKEASHNPPMDTCPACSAVVDSVGPLLSATCPNGHYLVRCSITLAILGTATPRTCLDCGRKAINHGSEPIGNGLYAELIDACDMCYYCTGKWYIKL